MFPRAISSLLEAARGRLSLQLVIYASLVLFCVVILLSSCVLLLRAYHRLRFRYRLGRRTLYEPAIEQVLMEAPLGEILETLRPRRRGDTGIVQEVMIENMRHLKGPPFETLREAAYRLGLIERNLLALGSKNKHRRGRAMEALGVMRASQAIVGILDILSREPLDMKLVALRALSEIGNPAVLPYFLKASDELPPAMMARLAALMMEFGASGREKIQELILRHPQAFPAHVMGDLLREMAADLQAYP